MRNACNIMFVIYLLEKYDMFFIDYVNNLIMNTDFTEILTLGLDTGGGKSVIITEKHARFLKM